MRVICIDDNQLGNDTPYVKKGNIYNVIESRWQPRQDWGSHYYSEAGYYYTLAETGGDYEYFSDMFIPINEDQQDETQFERNYNKQLL